MANSGYDGVVRIDNGNTHGYQARVGQGQAGKTKFFADGKWGGPEKALEHALSWREQNKIERSPIRFKDRRNSSGVIGVRRKQWVSYSEGGFEYRDTYWEAVWVPEPGKVKTALYSIREHGEWGAFFKAVERRKVEEASILGSQFQPLSYDEIEQLRAGFGELDIEAITATSEKKQSDEKKQSKKTGNARPRYSVCGYCNRRIADSFCDFTVLREGREQRCNKEMCADCAIDLDGGNYCRPHYNLSLKAARTAASGI